MEGIIADIVGKSPHSKEIITAFKPLFLVRERLIDELKLAPADRSSIDGEKLRQGIPCIGQTAFFLKGDPWEKIGLAVLPAMSEGFPALGEEVAKLEESIKAGDIRLIDAFADFPGSVESAVDRWSQGADIKPQAIGLLLGAVTRIVLQAKSAGIGEHIEGMGWDKGYLPGLRRPPDDRRHPGENPAALAALFPVRPRVALQQDVLPRLRAGEPERDGLFLRGRQAAGDGLHLQFLQALPDHPEPDQRYRRS